MDVRLDSVWILVLWCDALPYMKLMPTMPRPTTTIFLDPAAMVAGGLRYVTKGNSRSSQDKE